MSAGAIRQSDPIAWQNIPNEGGGWANWSPDSKEDTAAYARLLARIVVSL